MVGKEKITTNLIESLARSLEKMKYVPKDFKVSDTAEGNEGCTLENIAGEVVAFSKVQRLCS